MHRSFQVICLLIVSSFIAWAQPPGVAVVTFAVDFPTSEPEHYSIRIPSEGAARYESSGRLSADSDTIDNFELDFTVGAEMRQKVFGLAAKAGYFQKDVESHHKGLAFSGKKTLAYKDEHRSGEATYNYSTVTAVQDLTSQMQSLSSTLEFGHRLQYDLHYQKLALDEELKRMEDMARDNQVVELGAIRPILDQIIADQSVLNVSRARAQRLLALAAVH